MSKSPSEQRAQDNLSRREFMRSCAAFGWGALAASTVCSSALGRRKGRPPIPKNLKEAMFWEPAGEGKVRCVTCPNRCVRGEDGITSCRTRICRGGKLYTLIYNRPCVLQPDPITKNPLYHVDPGAEAIATATAGCNLICKYCQNHDIAQKGPWATKNFDLTPEQLVAKATDRGLQWLTMSYTEPTAYYEYAIDVAKVAQKRKVRVAVATAGYICAAPLRELVKHVDAFSVTIKGYTDKFYRDVCGCSIEDVWRSAEIIGRSGKWMEAVNLIVPGMNDEAEGIRSIAQRLVKINRDIPLHFLRFAPAYKLRHIQPTPLKTLEMARATAMKEGLRYVYIDLSGHQGSTTYCPRCKKALVERASFKVVSNRLKKGRCSFCSAKIPGLLL